MADTQEAPQAPAGLQPTPALGGSVTEAQEALLSLLEPEGKPQKMRKHNLPKKRSLNPKRKMNH